MWLSTKGVIRSYSSDYVLIMDDLIYCQSCLAVSNKVVTKLPAQDTEVNRMKYLDNSKHSSSAYPLLTGIVSLGT